MSDETFESLRGEVIPAAELREAVVVERARPCAGTSRSVAMGACATANDWGSKMDEFPKTESVQLNGGQWVDVIDRAATPPPPIGMLRCIYCGRLAEYDTARTYDEQKECAACPIDGQAMMGRCHGWKAEGAHAT